MIRLAAIGAAAAHWCALPMRRPSRPRAFAQIAQKARCRIEQIGEQSGVARLPRLTERSRRVAPHGKAEPARQGDSRRNASPFGKGLDNAAAPPPGERNDTSGHGIRVRRYRTGSRDDLPKTSRRRFGFNKRAGRLHIRRSLRIRGKQTRDPILLLGIEQPIGKGGQVEKSRRFILACVSHAGSLPQAAIRRLVWPMFWSFFASHHGNTFLPSLRSGRLEHPRNRGVHSTSARKWARSLIIALWWALRTVCGSIPRARAISETSISRSYSIVKISRWRGDNKASGSLSLLTGSTGSIARRPSGTASIGTVTGR